MDKRLQVFVDGHVQGVGFRWSAVKWARQLGLRGWVRNHEEDGNLEVIAEGPEGSLLALLAKLRRGPSGARILQVRDAWSAATGEFHDFRIET